MLQDEYAHFVGRVLTNACSTKRSGSQLSRLQDIFSRLATLKKTGKLPQASDINVGDQDLEPLEREIRRYNLRERVNSVNTL